MIYEIAQRRRLDFNSAAAFVATTFAKIVSHGSNMKPLVTLKKKDVKEILEAPPMKDQEVSLLIKGQQRPRAQLNEIEFYSFSNKACCRLLIFWSLITTLSSVVSIYYAIDAQNRLNEATDGLRFTELVGDNLAAKVAGFKEPRSSGDSSIVLLEIDGIVPTTTKDKINPKLLAGFGSLLQEAPKVISDFHAKVLHPMAEVIDHFDAKSAMMQDAKKLLDFINHNLKDLANNKDADLEDLGTKEHQHTFEELLKENNGAISGEINEEEDILETMSDDDQDSEEFEKIDIDLRENEIHESIDDGFSVTSFSAENIDDLEKQEGGYINSLLKGDEFFHSNKHESQIELLETFGNHLDLLEDFKIEIGKDGRDYYQTFDNGITKTRLRATNIKELKRKEMEFLETIKERKRNLNIPKKEMNDEMNKDLSLAITFDTDFRAPPKMVDDGDYQSQMDNYFQGQRDSIEKAIRKINGPYEIPKVDTDFKDAPDVEDFLDVLHELKSEKPPPNDLDSDESTEYHYDYDNEDIESAANLKQLQDELNFWLDRQFGLKK